MGKPVIVKKSATSGVLDGEYARLHRVVKILSLIQGEKGWTALRLAKECGVNERTIYRDMQLLEAAGIPCSFDEDQQCYCVRNDYFMRPIELTLDEALSIIALGEQIGKPGQVPFTQAAARAVAKIRGQLPESVREELQTLDHSMVIRLSQISDADAARDVFTKVQGAIARKHCLRCVYESSEKRYTKRFILKPYTLFFNQRAWYVVGYHGGHDQVRCLKLNRFAQIEETDIDYDVPKDFTLKKHLGNAWRMIRGEKTYSVVLQFDAKFAENIADTHWHETQQIDWNDDGSITFRCKVDGLDEIIWWVMSMGPYCRVVEPKELAERVRSLAQDTAKRYR